MARIFPLHGDEHDAVQAILPWYLTGTLEAADAERVHHHLAQCARCRADLAWQERARAAAPDPVAVTSERDVDRQWAALARRLVPAAPVSSSPSASEPRRGRAAWWPVAFAVQSALLATLALAWYAMPVRDDAYHALGSPAVAAANVLVVFRPTATEADMRAALRASHAQMVGGPTVTDAYLLRVQPLTSTALARLRAQPAVLHVDSLEAQAR